VSPALIRDRERLRLSFAYDDVALPLRPGGGLPHGEPGGKAARKERDEDGDEPNSRR